MSRFSAEFAPAAMTTASGVAALIAILAFRDQLPVPERVARITGFVVLYAGMALVVWAAVHLKGAMLGLVAPRRETLVTTGPFRLVRHPSYLGMTVALVGAGIVTASAVGIAAALLVFLPVEIHRARLEERALAATFGEQWKAYAARTGFLLPRPG